MNPDHTQSTSAPWRRTADWGLTAQCLLIGAVVLAAWALLAVIGWASSGAAGIYASTVAGAISLVAAWLACGVGRLCQGPAAAMYAMLCGMLIRMLLMFSAGIGLQLTVPPLAAAG